MRISVWSSYVCSSDLWDFYWNAGAPPCVGLGYHAAWINFGLFFWSVPENAGACSLTPGYDIPWLKYSYMEYGYELRTPNPLTMTAGEYRG